jgi:hypothetical protein
MVPLDYADNPLTVVTQSNSLVANFPPAMKTPQSTATCSAGTQLLGLTIIGTFSCDLADFDADGDLDVVVANSVDSNVLYLNYGVGDGTGFFGSKNTDPTPSSHSDADGIPAIAFPTLTPDWTGSSAVLDLILYGQSPVTACNGSAVVYHIPGKRIDSTTGVESEDVNGDGRPDVVFSNRNDIEDVMYKRCSCPAAPDCPGAPSCPAPDYDFLSQTYDYLFLNNSSFDGSGNYLWPFDAVERIGLPDDGTAYGQFADLNPPTLPDGDDRPDWLDANWRNATPADGGLQHVYFGNRLVSRTWVALNQGSPPNPIPFDLDLSLSNSDVGKTYVLFASCSGASSPPTPYMGFNVPLASAVPVTGSSGTVTNRHFQLTGSVSSPCGGTPCELFFTVFLISGTSGKATNITRTPVKCP